MVDGVQIATFKERVNIGVGSVSERDVDIPNQSLPEQPKTRKP